MLCLEKLNLLESRRENKVIIEISLESVLKIEIKHKNHIETMKGRFLKEIEAQ